MRRFRNGFLESAAEVPSKAIKVIRPRSRTRIRKGQVANWPRRKKRKAVFDQDWAQIGRDHGKVFSLPQPKIKEPNEPRPVDYGGDGGDGGDGGCGCGDGDDGDDDDDDDLGDVGDPGGFGGPGGFGAPGGPGDPGGTGACQSGPDSGFCGACTSGGGGCSSGANCAGACAGPSQGFAGDFGSTDFGFGPSGQDFGFGPSSDFGFGPSSDFGLSQFGPASDFGSPFGAFAQAGPSDFGQQYGSYDFGSPYGAYASQDIGQLAQSLGYSPAAFAAATPGQIAERAGLATGFSLGPLQDPAAQANISDYAQQTGLSLTAAAQELYGPSPSFGQTLPGAQNPFGPQTPVSNPQVGITVIPPPEIAPSAAGFAQDFTPDQQPLDVGPSGQQFAGPSLNIGVPGGEFAPVDQFAQAPQAQMPDTFAAPDVQVASLGGQLFDQFGGGQQFAPTAYAGTDQFQMPSAAFGGAAGPTQADLTASNIYGTGPNMPSFMGGTGSGDLQATIKENQAFNAPAGGGDEPFTPAAGSLGGDRQLAPAPEPIVEPTTPELGGGERGEGGILSSLVQQPSEPYQGGEGRGIAAGGPYEPGPTVVDPGERGLANLGVSRPDVGLGGAGVIKGIEPGAVEPRPDEYGPGIFGADPFAGSSTLDRGIGAGGILRGPDVAPERPIDQPAPTLQQEQDRLMGPVQQPTPGEMIRPPDAVPEVPGRDFGGGGDYYLPQVQFASADGGQLPGNFQFAAPPAPSPAEIINQAFGGAPIPAGEGGGGYDISQAFGGGLLPTSQTPYLDQAMRGEWGSAGPRPDFAFPTAPSGEWPTIPLPTPRPEGANDAGVLRGGQDFYDPTTGLLMRGSDIYDPNVLSDPNAGMRVYPDEGRRSTTEDPTTLFGTSIARSLSEPREPTYTVQPLPTILDQPEPELTPERAAVLRDATRELENEIRNQQEQAPLLPIGPAQALPGGDRRSLLDLISPITPAAAADRGFELDQLGRAANRSEIADAVRQAELDQVARQAAQPDLYAALTGLGARRADELGLTPRVGSGPESWQIIPPAPGGLTGPDVDRILRDAEPYDYNRGPRIEGDMPRTPLEDPATLFQGAPRSLLDSIVSPAEARDYGGARVGGYDITNYWPGAEVRQKQEGGLAGSGKYGADIPLGTLEQYVNGDSPYVSVAGAPSQNGRTGTMNVEFNGQVYKDVPFLVQDTGAKFPEGQKHFDVAVSNAYGQPANVTGFQFDSRPNEDLRQIALDQRTAPSDVSPPAAALAASGIGGPPYQGGLAAGGYDETARAVLPSLPSDTFAQRSEFGGVGFDARFGEFAPSRQAPQLGEAAGGYDETARAIDQLPADSLDARSIDALTPPSDPRAAAELAQALRDKAIEATNPELRSALENKADEMRQAAFDQRADEEVPLPRERPAGAPTAEDLLREYGQRRAEELDLPRTVETTREPPLSPNLPILRPAEIEGPVIRPPNVFVPDQPAERVPLPVARPFDVSQLPPAMSQLTSPIPQYQGPGGIYAPPIMSQLTSPVPQYAGPGGIYDPLALGTTPRSQGEVNQILANAAAQYPESLDWQGSVVDLMKLIGMDSSLVAREQLAADLGYEGRLNGSAQMNNFVYNAIMSSLRGRR